MSELLKSFDTTVVGVTFNNDDGSSRQQILSEIDADDPVTLEFYKYNGKPACAVYVFGKQIGHINKELAAELAKQYEGCYFTGKVQKILGGPEYNLHKYGCVIDIDIYDEEPISVKEITSRSSNTTKAEQALQKSQEKLEQAREELRQTRKAFSAQQKAVRDAAADISEKDKKHGKLYGIIYIVLGIIIAMISLLLLFVSWIAIIPAVFAILSIIRGYKCLKINNNGSNSV